MAEQEKKKLLITGGLGFIFSHVTEYFVAKGWEVVALDNQSAGSHPEIIDGSFKYHHIDVSENSVIDLIVEENPEFIIHAAAISDVDFSINNPMDTIHKNAIGNLNLFEACRKLQNLKKMIYVSTDEVYGECAYKKKETDIIFPRNPYACSKAIGSLLRLSYDNTYDILKNKTAETRFCNVFGPRQDKRKIIPNIINSLVNNVALPVHNGGGGYREYIYVKNIPPALELILEKGNRTYNITNNEGFVVNDLIKKIEVLTGKEVEIQESQRAGMDTKYEMDGTRIREDLGWFPTYSIDDGLKEYLESFDLI